MKKLLSVVLALALTLGVCASAMADVDLSSVRNSDIFYINVESSGNAFVGSFIPYSWATFDHPNAVDGHASFAYSDIIVTDYYGTTGSQRAVWRWWLEYNAPYYLGITSVTFDLDGTYYTFSGVGGTSQMEDNGSYVTENICLVFGSENMMFWLLFLFKCEALDDITEIADWTMPVVLHGTRDVETEMNGYALLDLYLVGEAALQITGFDGLYATDGSAMTYTEPETGKETPDAESIEADLAVDETVEVEEAVEVVEETVEEAVQETVEEAVEKTVKEAAEAVEEAARTPYEFFMAAVEAVKMDDETAEAACPEPGSYLTFGHYEQDNDLTNGEEPIEWLVLEVDEANSKALVISRYGLDAKPYNTEWADVTWETCTLRAWLNNDFLNAAFTADEQAAILTTAVDNSDSQGYSGWSTNGGNNTQDKIFLLSYAEANQYLGVEHWSVDDSKNNTRSRVAPTAYAIAQGAWTYSDYYQTADGAAAGWWWLRSPGVDQINAAYVKYDGALYSYYVNYESASVRPAFWINLESGIF